VLLIQVFMHKDFFRNVLKKAVIHFIFRLYSLVFQNSPAEWIAEDKLYDPIAGGAVSASVTTEIGLNSRKGGIS